LFIGLHLPNPHEEFGVVPRVNTKKIPLMINILTNTSFVLPTTFSMFKFPKHLVSLVEIPNDKCLPKDLLFNIGGLVYYLNQVHHHSRVVRKIVNHYDSLLNNWEANVEAWQVVEN
jgi:hypothetical protein